MEGGGGLRCLVDKFRNREKVHEGGAGRFFFLFFFFKIRVLRLRHISSQTLKRIDGELNLCFISSVTLSLAHGLQWITIKTIYPSISS